MASSKWRITCKGGTNKPIHGLCPQKKKRRGEDDRDKVKGTPK